MWCHCRKSTYAARTREPKNRLPRASLQYNPYTYRRPASYTLSLSLTTKNTVEFRRPICCPTRSRGNHLPRTYLTRSNLISYSIFVLYSILYRIGHPGT
ncbi:hypothetical protein PNOK_0502700 [Pyrrhoderma noxium]|uniref:Uncharacterized protein n=1 Tax=Pyrrhoderma noxium TaxID=2282107 RepID=A0A286UKF5_9AGAM|nr:hypothetical protein PNOK_0502700 [Pyrrhoderma noxium]